MPRAARAARDGSYHRLVTASIALVTCSDLPGGDEDAALLTGALSAAGLDARWLVWDDPGLNWSAYDLAVVRSTWDYTRDRDGFLAWSGRVPRLANTAEVISWNTDKTYLRDAAAEGIATVPTTWSDPGGALTFPQSEFVVKPSIGAGSMGVGRFDPVVPGALDAARAHAESLHDAGRTVMVQPYLDEVDVAGETALIYFDGVFSHAVRKGPMLAQASVNEFAPGMSRSLYVPERISARAAGPDELRVGEQVLAMMRRRFGGDLLYTRVDVLPSPDGPVVVEIELTEPSLFVEHGDGAAARFAAAMSRRAG